MQKVEVYQNYWDAYELAEVMQREIEYGWRVHCCLDKSGFIIVVYEKEE